MRLLDSEEKLAMCYLYETMDKIKEDIKTRLKNRISQYGPYIRVIDARWDNNFIVHYMQQIVFLILEYILGLLFQNKRRLLEVCLAQLLDWFLNVTFKI